MVFDTKDLYAKGRKLNRRRSCRMLRLHLRAGGEVHAFSNAERNSKLNLSIQGPFLRYLRVLSRLNLGV